MKVTLLNYTDNAASLLTFVKNTRLNMTADKYQEHINGMVGEHELEYISNTIKSSWEFIDYTFLIEGVSRAFTHQLVRNRHGSYAQQTMRVLNVSGFDYVTGPSIADCEELQEDYADYMAKCDKKYGELIDKGAKIEDARGILPTNICTNIVAKYNLRTISEMMASRSSPRTQGEYRDVLNEMYLAIIEVHPWAEMFLKDKKYEAAQKLDSIIKEHFEGTEKYLEYIKLVDILRK